MGNFLEPQEMKDKATANMLRELDLEALDDTFILPAEAAINEAANLMLDTDLEPYGWAARFERYPNELTKFQDAMRRATIITVNQMAVNPSDFASQSVGGASVQYSSAMVPARALVLLRQWGRSGSVYRA